MDMGRDLIPDEPSDVVAPNLAEQGEIFGVIERAESTLEALGTALVMDLAAPIVEAEGVINQIDTACIGEICHYNSRADVIGDKLTAKMANDVWATITSAAQTLSLFGFTWPLQEEIDYAKATNDYLGVLESPIGSDAARMEDVSGLRGAVNDGDIGISASGIRIGNAGGGNGADDRSYHQSGDNNDRSLGTLGDGPNAGKYGASGASGITSSGIGNSQASSGISLPLPDEGGYLPPSSNPPVKPPPYLPPEPPPYRPPVNPPTNPNPDEGTNKNDLILVRADRTCVPWTDPITEPSVAMLEPPFSAPSYPNCTPSQQLKSTAWMTADMLPIRLYIWNPDTKQFRWDTYYRNPGWYVGAIQYRADWYPVPIQWQFDPCNQQACAPSKPPDNPPPPNEPPLQPPNDPGKPPPPPNPPPPNPPPPPPAECEGVVPLVPRFDDTVQCKRSMESLDRFDDNFDHVLSAIKPTNKGPALRPSSTIGGAIWDAVNILLGGRVNAVINAPYNATTYAGKVMRRILCMSDCNPDRLRSAALLAWAGGFMNSLAGGTLSFMVRPLHHLLNRQCPYELPSVAEANGAYMADAIDSSTWECWVSANGSRIEPQKKMLEAGRARPNINEITTLYMRGKINENEWRVAMRQLGVTSDLDRERYSKLVEAYPGVDDVIRFLVRDVADKDIVTKFGMDDGFGDKWQGDLIQYAKAQGVSDALAKNYWRAHWQLPSPTQLYVMQHRFGNDREGIPDNLRLDADAVKECLEQNDILPFWIDKLVAASYSPLTRTDAKRAYKIGAIDETGLYNSFRDNGYNDANAKVLVEFTKQEIASGAAKIAGLPNASSYVKAFIRGEITSEQLQSHLFQAGKKPVEIAIIITRADEAKKLQRRTARIQTVRKGYMHGLISVQEATRDLVAAGVDTGALTDLLNNWTEDMGGRRKLPSVSNLCRWASNGWIDRQTHLDALMRLGYGEDDAVLLAADCAKTASEKLQKKAEQNERRDMSAAEKAKAKEQRLAERLFKEFLKATEEIVKQDVVAAKLIDKVEKWYDSQSKP